MGICQKVQNARWFPFWIFFGVQKWLWWLLLAVVIPDCKKFVDERIQTKADQDRSKAILDEIYKFLGILDSKASALMRYNSIILAVLALMERGTSAKLPHVTIYIVVMTIVSILACLLVVGVYWRFLEWVDPDARENLSGELDALRRALVMREAAYQIAWWMSLAVLLLFLWNFRQFLPSIASCTVPSIAPGAVPKAG